MHATAAPSTDRITLTIAAGDAAAGWVTLHVAVPEARDGGLVLAAEPDGTIVLVARDHGASEQEWAPVDPAPVAPPGRLEGTLSCLRYWGCPFHVHEGTPHTFANRFTGRHLTFYAA
jgi:hypothetical protein